MTALDRIDGISAGVAYKAPVKAVTNAAITLSGEQTINGVAVVTGDRVLVKDQADQTTNGIYDVAQTAWARSLDFDGQRDVVQGTLVTVAATSTSTAEYKLTTANPIVIGTSALTFVETAASSSTAINSGRDGRTILEASPVTDSSAEFLSGGTFTLDPTNARHYNLQVGDSETALTAGMTIDLAPDSASWPDTAQVIVTKGDDSEYTVTLSGLDADGLGTYALTEQFEGVILGYHHTDGEDGPGAAGQKWKLVSRFTRTRMAAVESAITTAIGAVVPIPEGTNGTGGRDGSGEIVLFTNDDGTITFNADGANRYIRAVTALAAHARTVTTIAADTTSTAAHLVTQVEAGTSNTGTTILKLEHGTPATALNYEFAKSSAISPAGGSIVLWVSPDQEGAVTLDTEDDAGTINGETSVEVSPGFIYTAVILENPGSAPTIYLSGPVVAQATTLQGGVHERVVTASVSGAVTIDMSAGSHHVLTMTGNVTGVTLSGRAPDGMSANVRVDWVQDGSGGHTIAHPTGTRWAGGTAPTFVTTAGAVNTVAYSAIGASGAIDGFDGGMGRATP